jgi:AcrR family transcriptional regulator
MSALTARAIAKEKILESAVKLFADKGFSGTTTKEIAEKSGVNEALIFRYFSTKKDLYGSIIEKKINEEPGIEKPLESYGATKDDWYIFRSIAFRMFDKCGRDPDFIRLLHYSALEGHELSDMFFDTYVEYVNKLLSEYIKDRISDGVFKKINPLVAARAFIGMVINYIIAQELFREKRKGNIKQEDIVESFVTIFLEGIKT